VDRLVSVDYNVSYNAYGEVVYGSEVTSEDDNFARRIKLEHCNPQSAKDFEAKGYSLLNNTNKEFTVTPNVPRGAGASVSATVVFTPPTHCAGDLDSCVGAAPRFTPSIVDWIVYRALSMDMESEFAFRAAEKARERFYDAMRYGYLQESRHGSGYYLGESGGGDSNVVQRSSTGEI